MPSRGAGKVGSYLTRAKTRVRQAARTKAQRHSPQRRLKRSARICELERRNKRCPKIASMAHFF